MLEIIIYALLIFIGIIVFTLANRKRHQPAEGKQQEKWLKRKLLTDNELRCFQALTQCVDKDENISCKVRLADIIEPEKRLERSEWHKRFNRIKSKHVDFVITDKKTMETIIAIELDDASHRRNDRMKRDDFVNACLKSANIKFLRLNSYKTYMPERIKGKILETIQNH